MGHRRARDQRHVAPAYSDRMDVRIGVTQTPKEIHVELADGAEQASSSPSVEKALADRSGVLWLTDRKGRRVGVPAGKVAYIEIGSPSEDRRVGFALAHLTGVVPAPGRRERVGPACGA